MKQIIFYELMRKLRHKPNLKRKLKIFAWVGVIAFVVLSGMMVWAGLSAVNYVASKANQILQSPMTQQHFESLKTEVQLFPKFQALNCWNKAQSLMSVEPRLARPALENINNLTLSCLEKKPAVCEGNECSQLKQLIHTAEGTTI